MNESDLPELYRAADAASVAGRKGHFRLAQAELLLLVLAALLSVMHPLVPSSGIRWEQAAAALLLAIALVLKLAQRLRAFDEQWFDGRAVAETVKSASWRYTMHIPPYDRDDDVADAAFLDALRDTLQSRGDLAAHLSSRPPHHQQITEGMRRLRALPLPERRDTYLRGRASDQVDWYAARARANRRSGGRWFWVSLGFEGAALVAAIALVAQPDGPDLVALFAAISAAATAWTQMERHNELSKSYGLAAQELALLMAAIETSQSPESFVQAVTETEGAISREHTMWVARRG